MPHARTAALIALLSTTVPATRSLAQSRIPIPIPQFGAAGATAQATPFELAIGRGDQALRRSDWSTAEREFQTAARLDARDPRPQFYLGEVEMRQSHWPAAEAHFRAAVRLNPRMAEAHAELGSVLREQSRGADAIAELENATRLDARLPEAHFNLALALEDANQPDRALAEYRRAVQLAPESPMPALDLGILLAGQHPAAGSPQRAEALRVLQSAVRASNNDHTVLAAAGPALRMLGEARLAADVLERARTQGPATPSLLAELAQALWAAGNHAQALTRIDEAVRASPDSAELHYVRGLMRAGQGDRPGAQTEMRAVLRLGAGTPLAERARAHIGQLAHPTASGSAAGF
jgi:tetratricopeptide (TPR) repeat protein